MQRCKLVFGHASDETCQRQYWLLPFVPFGKIELPLIGSGRVPLRISLHLTVLSLDFAPGVLTRRHWTAMQRND